MRNLWLLLFLAACGGGGGGGGGSPSPTLPAPVVTPDRPPSTSPVTSPATPIVGLGTHSLGYEAINELGMLRVRYTRFTMYAALWELSESYRAEWTAGLALAFSHGLKVLVVVHALPPHWTGDDFGRFMGDRALEFGPMLEGFQLGNEIPFGDGSPASHAHFHTSAYHAIKSVSRDTKVVTMAMPDSAFPVLLQSTNLPTDAYAVHLYGYPLSGVTKRLRKWISANVPVWVTEVGIEQKVIPPDAGPWEQIQARELRDAVDAGHGYARIYIYQLRTFDGELHGLLRDDGTLRPAAEWLASRSR